MSKQAPKMVSKVSSVYYSTIDDQKDSIMYKNWGPIEFEKIYKRQIAWGSVICKDRDLLESLCKCFTVQDLSVIFNTTTDAIRQKCKKENIPYSNEKKI